MKENLRVLGVQADRLLVSDEMHFMPASRQLDPQLRTHHTAATVGGITGNSYFHDSCRLASRSRSRSWRFRAISRDSGDFLQLPRNSFGLCLQSIGGRHIFQHHVVQHEMRVALADNDSRHPYLALFRIAGEISFVTYSVQDLHILLSGLKMANFLELSPSPVLLIGSLMLDQSKGHGPSSHGIRTLGDLFIHTDGLSAVWFGLHGCSHDLLRIRSAEQSTHFGIVLVYWSCRRTGIGGRRRHPAARWLRVAAASENKEC